MLTVIRIAPALILLLLGVVAPACEAGDASGPAQGVTDATADADAVADSADDLEVAADAVADTIADVPVEDTGADAATDPGADVATDVDVDPGADVAADTGADVAADMGADVAADTGADVAADTGAADTGADGAADTTPDTGPARVDCREMPFVFPEYEEACAVDADCALVLHTSNCCGTEVAWGIAASEVPSFEADEAQCDDESPKCGCPTLPTTADDGTTHWDPAAFHVRCRQGACHSSTVDCASAPPVFPDFDRACTADADCAVAFHTINCCGTDVALGIAADSVAAFDKAEATCDADYPGCGCASTITEADDGSTAWERASFGARCAEGGTCQSYAISP